MLFTDSLEGNVETRPVWKIPEVLKDDDGSPVVTVLFAVYAFTCCYLGQILITLCGSVRGIYKMGNLNSKFRCMH